MIQLKNCSLGVKQQSLTQKYGQFNIVGNKHISLTILCVNITWL